MAELQTETETHAEDNDDSIVHIPQAESLEESEIASSDKYNVAISSGSEEESVSTEDQLDDLYLKAPKESEGEARILETHLPVEPSQPSDGTIGHSEPSDLSTRIAETEDMGVDAGLSNDSAQRSVNMEDSQAELLLNSLDDSMYRSAIRNAGLSVDDEFHSLESSEIAQPSAAYAAKQRSEGGDDFEYMSAKHSVAGKLEDSISRSYVITPSAFINEEGPVVVTHIRPDHAAGEQASEQSAATAKDPGPQRIDAEVPTISAQDISESSMTDSYVHVATDNDAEVKNDDSKGTETELDESTQRSKASQRIKEIMDKAKESTSNAADKAGKLASNAKDATNNAADKATKNSKKAADDAADAANEASSKAKDMLDNASKSVKDAAASANDKAHDAIHKARESGEKFAKKAREEANEAEKAVRKHANETSPVTLKTLGIVAVALAGAAGYYYRLPGRQNQRIGFAGAVASAIIGLGTMATAFIRRNN
ncbi:hypothetical protein GGH99_000949 [Coemansia sp. RSA 1285]|nr:hypothetical protein GGH99_000949 [Coemansia sp. RSA 1285]